MASTALSISLASALTSFFISYTTKAAYSYPRRAYVRYGIKYIRIPRKRRPSENAVEAKFVEFSFSALGRSFFDGAAPAETRLHRSDGPCQRIRLRHLLCPATICSTPMQGTSFRDSLLLTYC